MKFALALAWGEKFCTGSAGCFRNAALVPTQLFAIAFEVAFRLAETVAAKLFAHRSSEDQCDHRLANHTSGGHGGGIWNFKTGGIFLPFFDIYRSPRPAPSRKTA